MQRVLVVDFGSQYSQLIARIIRELGVYSELLPANKPNIHEIAKQYDAIIFSGGPNSVFDQNSLTIDKAIFEIGKPILGTCYGMQLIHHLLGGKVETLVSGEYGKVELSLVNNSLFTSDIDPKSVVWMSHFDSVTKMAPGFVVLGNTLLCNAISANETKRIYTTQFHPEVTHTQFGRQLISNFLFKIAQLDSTWTTKNIANEKIEHAKKIIGQEKVILGLSGGVDSSVMAALLARAVGTQLVPVFVDNGLLRKNERQLVQKVFEEEYGIKLQVVDAQERFYSALKGISDPEQKRKIIGKVFIDVFTEAKKQHQNAKFLAQGTIYPDVIESAGVHGIAHKIKSHHNVSGLPEEVNFILFEPLRELFKDEVRKLGFELGLSKEIVMRHPFPGPGLGIRIIGDITPEKVAILQDVDSIMIAKLYEKGIYDQVAQAAAILTPIKTVGVQGDERTYEYLVALRIVQTTDFMTAHFAKLDWEVLEEIANAIIAQVPKVNRVVYDITSKPPATIEWE